MHGVHMVLFQDEAGNVLVGVEWDIDEWIVFCDVTEECEWRHRHPSLDASVDAAAKHIEWHQLVGVGV